MQLIRTTLAALAATFAFALAAQAQPVRGDNIESELVAETTAIVPGQPLTVALRLKHDPHWHTYWQVPGDSGLPTTIKWALPEGWSAGPIQWPVPQRLCCCCCQGSQRFLWWAAAASVSLQLRPRSSGSGAASSGPPLRRPA